MKASCSVLCCLTLLAGGLACGDGSAPDSGNKQAFQAPILDDPTDLGQTVDLQGHVDFGASVVGHFSDSRPLIGYLLDALRGARLTLELQASQDGNDDPVLVLYGPADASGIMGEKIALDDDGRDGRNSLIDGLALPADGTYLVLVTSYSGRDTGEYKLTVGCRGNCGEPVCPDILCDLYCPNGFMTDENGCPICRCRENPEYCRTDRDCPDGFFCNPCPPANDVDPVAGGNGDAEGGSEDLDGDGNRDESDPGTEPVCGPPRCEPIHNDYCESDADCPPGYACELRWDEVPLCDENYDAAGNPTDPDMPCYEPPQGVCVPRQHECFSDDDCPAGYHCELPFLDQGMNCEPNADGTVPDDCLPPGGVCMPDELKCQSDADCPEGMVCEWFRDGVATDPETGDVECYPGERCGWDHGICVPGGCICPDIWAPVCAVTPWGEEMTFGNVCEAECEGARIIHEGECGGQNLECFSDFDCPPGFRCEMAVWDDANCFDENGEMDPNCIPEDCIDAAGNVRPDCMPQGPGVCVPAEVECRTDSDCPPGFACELRDFMAEIDWDLVEELCAQDPAFCEELFERCQYEPEYCRELYCQLVDPSLCEAVGVCVPRQMGCLDDSDCAPGERCELIDGCLDGDQTDPDGNGIDCAPYGVCVPITEGCLEDADCPEGFRCELTYWADPDDTQGCEEGDPNCIPPCDPTTGEYCGEPYGRCVPMEYECFDDRDCPDGFFCALPPCHPSGEACNADSDCGPNGSCWDGMCVYEDGTIPDCGPGICQPRQTTECIVSGCSGQVCAPYPVDTTCEWLPEYECLQFSVCTVVTADGACGWLETPEYIECLERIHGQGDCTSNADCAPGEFCLDGKCQFEDCVCPDVWEPVCGALNWDGLMMEQTFGNLCELRCAGAELLYEGECEMQAECRTDADCGPGFVCDTCPPDPSCPMCDVCGPPVCVFVGGCDADTDCPPGTMCDAATGTCVDARPPCNSDAECEDGSACINGVCGG